MYKQIVKLVIVPAVLAMSVLSVSAHAAQTVMPEVQKIQQEWSQLYFLKEFKNKNYKALQALARKANRLSQANPDSAEALTWDAIVLSTLAEKKGGLGALSLVKEAKKKLEAAESIDPTALGGSVYGSLATLYWKVPGWPIGFGSDTKAEQYFGKALKLNPNQLDLNYFYADYLADNNETELALLHLEKAIHAPKLVGRPIADQGRRAQATKLRDYLLTLDKVSVKVSKN
jgi:tetratricopeptide (TPR) repeat protein